MNYITQTDKKGIVRYRCQYNQKGQKHGIAEIFRSKGDLWQSITFVNGKRNGITKTYKDNELCATEEYKNNKKHGMEVSLKDGIPYITTTWMNGKKHGPQTYSRTNSVYHFHNDVLIKKIFGSDREILVLHYDPITGQEIKMQQFDKDDVVGGKEEVKMEIDLIENKTEMKQGDSKCSVTNNVDGSNVIEMMDEDGTGVKITKNESTNTHIIEGFFNGVIDKIITKIGENTYRCLYHDENGIVTHMQIERHLEAENLLDVYGSEESAEIVERVDYNPDGSIKR